jgi:tetratricopeptide (TPR) repeat protein
VSFEPDAETAPPAPAITGNQAIRRSSGSVNTIQRDRDGRFDLDDDGPRGAASTGDTTSRRGVDDVELELDDFGGNQDEVILGAGADPSEAHADEIAKILTETDVYTKYGLHQKAIEHLKKVFEIDPRNSEAREKLKDVYIALGRNAEAATELVRLAEQAAPGNPHKASAYLRELFAIAPGDARGQAVVTRYRLEVDTDMSGGDVEVEAELEVESAAPELTDEADIEVERNLSGPVEIDADMDLAVSASDLDAGVAVATDAEVGVEFDELGLDMPSGPVTLSTDSADAAHDLPDVSRSANRAGDGDMDFDLDELSAATAQPELPPLRRESTQVVSDDQVELSSEDYNEAEPDEAPLAFDDGATRFDDGPGRLEAASQQMASEFDLGDGPEWDGPADPVPVPVAQPGSSMHRSASVARPVAQPAPAPAPSFDEDEFALDNSPSTGVDGDAAELLPPVPEPDHLAITGDGGGEETAQGAAASASTGGGSSLEDDLDEADFFVGQNLFNEAKDILNGLLSRYPKNPLVQAKLQDVLAMERAAGMDDDDGATHGDLGAEPPVELRAPSAPPPAARPAVIARAMGDSDADTHYDLGLAYKEMGLFDEAIKEFHLVRETPGRAVQCHLMIGLCHVERGKLSEAVGEFKNGLYVEGINERESLALYFELGVVYEALGDAREALYYYEKVSKRDPRFRDVAGRSEGVKQKIAAGNDRRLSGDSTLDAASTGDDFSR